MLRNDLITALAQHDNDTVTVDVGALQVDIASVTTSRGVVTIILDPEDIESALNQIVRKRTGQVA
jgi:hypothetical protein